MDTPLLFLSHAGEDSLAAKDLALQLREAGIRLWLDVEELKPGDRWMEALEDALDQADAFAVYVGRSGIARWVDRELRVALDRNAVNSSFRIIPILGPGADPQSVPPFLAQHQWLDLRKAVSAAELKNLVGTILEKVPEVVSLISPGESPFRGLQYFDVEHAHLFFGRDQEVAELLDCLRANSFLAVIGDSGSGKSSLVRAGLVPALNRGRFHDGKAWAESWRIAICRPGNSPFRELANALPDLTPDLSPAQRIEVLGVCKNQLVEGVDGLYDSIMGLVPVGTRTLLIVDQFEELFTLTSSPQERCRFIDSLIKAAESVGDRPVHTLITLRADFYSRCWKHPDLLKRIVANQYAVQRATQAQLSAIVEKPLKMAGSQLEAGLINVIINDVGDEPGNLPLLEHALLQLWERRTSQTLTHRAYEEIGRVSGAVARQADDLYEQLEQPEKELAHKIFLRLTRLGEGTEDTRRQAAMSELVTLPGSSDAIEGVVRTLADARLLTTSADVDERWVDVAHESLIRSWPRLRQWIVEDREGLRIHRRLTEAALEWKRLKPDEGGLYRGVRLAEAVEWRKYNEAALNEFEKNFLNESLTSHKKSERRRRRNRQATIVAAAALLLLTAFAGYQWFRADKQAENVIRSALKESAIAVEGLVDSKKPIDAIALAVDSVRRSMTQFNRVVVEAKVGLKRALESARMLGIVYMSNTPIEDVYLDKDTNRFVAIDAVSIYKGKVANSSGESLALPETNTSGKAYYTHSPDGSLFAILGVDSSLQILERDANVFTPIPLDLRVSNNPSNSCVHKEVTPTPEGIAYIEESKTFALAYSWKPTLVLPATQPRSAYCIGLWSNMGKPLSTLSPSSFFQKPTGHSADFRIVAHPVKPLVAVFAEAVGIEIWDFSSSELPILLDAAELEQITAFAFDPHSKDFTLGRKDGGLELWSFVENDNAYRQQKIRMYHDTEITALAFSLDGSLLAAGEESGYISVSTKLGRQPFLKFRAHRDSINALAFDAGSKRLFSASGNTKHIVDSKLDNSVRISDVSDPFVITSIAYNKDDGGSLAVSADLGVMAILNSASSEVDILNYKGRVMLKVPIAASEGRSLSYVQSVFALNGNNLAILSGIEQPFVWGFSGQKRYLDKAVPLNVTAVAKTPHDDRILMGGIEGQLMEWSFGLGTLREFEKSHDEAIESISFTSDGRLMAVGSSDGWVSIWRDGQRITKFLVDPFGVRAVSFSPTGEYIAVGSNSRSLTIWSSEGGKLTDVGQLKEMVTALSPVGDDYFVSGAEDGKIHLWHRSGEPVGDPLIRHDDEIISLNYDDSTKHLISYGRDNTLNVWDMRWQSWFRQACERLRQAKQLRSTDSLVKHMPASCIEKMEDFVLYTVETEPPFELPPLENAVWRADSEGLRALLLEGHPVDYYDEYGQTALMLASRTGQSDLVEVLLGHGADTGATDVLGRIALHHAVEGESLESVNQLIKVGTNANARDSTGLTPFERAKVLDLGSIQNALVDAGMGEFNFRKEDAIPSTYYSSPREWDPSDLNQDLVRAMRYMRGDGVPQSIEDGIAILAKWATTGDLFAKYQLGRAYDFGAGVPKDSRKAYQLQREAAVAGMPIAQNSIGYSYQYGEGVAVDYRQAAFWYKRAAKAGYPIAMGNLANMYRDGEGVEQSYAKAAELHRAAIEAGTTSFGPYLNLSYFHDYGLAVERSPEIAFEFLLSAATLDDASERAMFLVAERYELGFGVERSIEEAISWFRQAASAGNEEAGERLNFLEKLSDEQRLSFGERTERHLRAILKRDPDNAIALNSLGYFLVDQTTHYQEGIDLIKRALVLMPDDAATLDSMGWAQYRLGNNTEAIKYLGHALSIEYDAEIASHFDEVLKKLNP